MIAYCDQLDLRLSLRLKPINDDYYKENQDVSSIGNERRVLWIRLCKRGNILSEILRYVFVSFNF